MKVTFYGVRGSIPVPGPSTVRYGGNTVCVGVRTADGTLIQLDAGTGARVLGDELLATGVPKPVHVFLTHGHWDHIMGAPFFGPLWRPDTHIIVHAMTARNQKKRDRMVLFDGDHFPVRREDIPCRLEQPPAEARIRAGSAVVTTIALNHPGGCDGFRIDDDDGSSLCYLTDNELGASDPVTSADELARFARGAGLLIHDAQYMRAELAAKRGWGHSAVEDVLELGRAAEARVLALHHHDPWRHDAALDATAAGAEEWTRAHAPSMRALVASEGLVLDVAGGRP
jgi:phosphoribosyl 1,2-cyclic phosphodiesterase